MQLHYGQLWQGKALQCDITAIQQTGPGSQYFDEQALAE